MPLARPNILGLIMLWLPEVDILGKQMKYNDRETFADTFTQCRTGFKKRPWHLQTGRPYQTQHQPTQMLS